QHIEGRTGIAGRAARTGDNFHTRRHLTVDQQRLARRRGALLDDLEIELAGGLDDPLRALDVADAWQLHHDLVAVGALLRDLRLGDAHLVDAALDPLHTPRHP